MYDDGKTGYGITAIAAGMDELERRLRKGEGELDEEGLIPIYLGRDLVRSRRYERWEQASEELDQAAIDVAECPLAPRRRTLEALLRSLRAAMGIFRGQRPSFADKLESLVGVPAGGADEAEMASLREEIDAALTRLRIPGASLAERVAAWRASRSLPARELERVYGELQEEAARRTAERVYDVGGFRMRLVLRPGSSSGGRCSFDTATMEINTDLGCTRSAMKHLVTHENFPGHATQILYTRDAYLRGEATADVLLCALNGLPGVIQEGIGDQATELIDWVEDDDDLLQIALRRLRIAAATTASWRLMQLGEAEAEAASYLRERGFAVDPYVDGRIAQAKHPYKGPFNASYYFGDKAVREVRLRAGEAGYPGFIRFLYGNIHCLPSFLEYGGAGTL
ncbi:MAG TPA: hypothetical protein P5133_02705 [Spirochaetia bacterium]|nr:hypothetical protein [Spirochaetia bacterium]HRZ63811.1 hypothetical protein [Spirochaetia bacterium]